MIAIVHVLMDTIWLLLVKQTANHLVKHMAKTAYGGAKYLEKYHIQYSII
jgi:hypothetical protein